MLINNDISQFLPTNLASSPCYNAIMANNYDFIGSQNVNLGVRGDGWRINWKKFRPYLHNEYKITKAYLFLGFISEYTSLYNSLQDSGFTLVFKTVRYQAGKPKGNVDAELVLQAMIDYPKYDLAIIGTSDGDFAYLVRYLDEQKKLLRVLSPNCQGCSALLKRVAKGLIAFLDDVRPKIEYTK
jgi:uncharacterized LabA/DUF88 family protein